tara:strand:- start:242 stop:415 length:174 start_codon:yes stop_codon:yes gene_type:complete
MIGRRHAVRDRGGCEAQELREGTQGMHILEEYTMAQAAPPLLSPKEKTRKYIHFYHT